MFYTGASLGGAVGKQDCKTQEMWYCVGCACAIQISWKNTILELKSVYIFLYLSIFSKRGFTQSWSCLRFCVVTLPGCIKRVYQWNLPIYRLVVEGAFTTDFTDPS